MFKKIITLITSLTLIALTGCSLVKTSTTETVNPASIRTIRDAKIGKTWAIKQLEITLETETPILLKVKDGDKVDGYFYVVKGDNINFNISGLSTIYTSKPDAVTARVTADRFSFTASQAQGLAYTLTFSPAGSSKNGTTVFLELIYPATGTLFDVSGTK